jgi:hypothetical protein
MITVFFGGLDIPNMVGQHLGFGFAFTDRR